MEVRRSKCEVRSTKYECLVLRPSSFDPLTVMLHEFGHVLGLDDLDPQTHTHELMAAALAPGERRGVGVSQRDADPTRGAIRFEAAGQESGTGGQAAGRFWSCDPMVVSATSASPSMYADLTSQDDSPRTPAMRVVEDCLDDFVRRQSGAEREVDLLFAEW